MSGDGSGYAPHAVKDLVELLTKSGLCGVEVNGDVISYPLAGGNMVYLKVATRNFDQPNPFEVPK